MPRILTVAAAQMGPLQKSDSRAEAVRRMTELMRRANGHGAQIVVFPELALTTFFPRWYMEDWAEVDRWFETEMPSVETRPLFETAAALGLGFHLGYAEKTVENGKTRRFNTAIFVEPSGRIAGKYRKVHLPGHAEYDPGRAWQHLEKRYFDVGDLGFPAFRSMDGIFGLCICNDRRWPETWRVLGLQAVELVMLGYNTPVGNSLSATEAPHTRMFHNHLSIQAGAYQNGTWAVGVAKAGDEDGHPLMGGSCIVDPSGQIVAQARTMEDEVIVAEIDLDACAFNKTTIFDFAAHRRIEHYGRITEQTGVMPPD